MLYTFVLQIVKHDPFDCPSAGFVYKNNDGSNVVLVEKVNHSSAIRNVAPVGSASTTRRRVPRTAVKVGANSYCRIWVSTTTITLWKPTVSVHGIE